MNQVIFGGNGDHERGQEPHSYDAQVAILLINGYDKAHAVGDPLQLKITVPGDDVHA